MTNIDARTLTRPELETIGADLVLKLGGHWHGGRGMCRCPVHSDRSPSLSIRVGHTNLLFHCFAGCETAAILTWIRCTRPEALGAASPSVAAPVADTAWLRARAQDLWAEALPIRDTPAAHYFRGRAIAIDSSALRFHWRTPIGGGRRLTFRPALLALVSDDHKHLAVQRTFLDPKTASKARDLGKPRRLLGRPGRGAVRLFAHREVLGLAEGIETALSAALLLHIPVWAVLGNERFSQISIPDAVSRVILLPDNDRAGRSSAATARDAFSTVGKRAEIMLPWHSLNDWNDVLRSRMNAKLGKSAFTDFPESCPV